MNDAFAWWLGIAGLGIGISLAWLVLGRLPRTDDDVDAVERAAEARWISQVITERGGALPVPLVEEVLELHSRYLAGTPVLEAPIRDETAWDDAETWAAEEAAAAPEDDPGPAARSEGPGPP